MIEVRPIGEAELAFVDARLPLSRLGAANGEYLVAWSDGEPVGHAHISWQADVPEVQDVFVIETHRRRGVARAVTAAAERRARGRGFKRLELEVSVDNAAARGLYEQLGYRRTADAPRRVQGTIVIRGEPLVVDDTLLRFAKVL